MSNQPGRKLSDDNVRAIRKSDLPQDALATIYGVSQQLISDIKLGKRRANVMEEAKR